jgi:hypothetical protein
MKSLNRKCLHFPVLVLALALGAMPAAAALTPTDVLDLHQRWLDSTDNFLADVYVVEVQGENESLVSQGLLLFDQSKGDVSYLVEEIPCEVMPYALAPLRVEKWAGAARAGAAGIGYSDIPLTSGPFKDGSWDLFSRGSTTVQTLKRLSAIASDVRAVEGTGILTGLEGLLITLDEGFKSSYQGIVEQVFGGELMADKAWKEPQQLELWFDAEDGRIHQISSIAPGVRRDVLFDYAAVDLSAAELADTREKLAVPTSDPPFPSFTALMDAFVGARSSPVAMQAGLPLIAGILLLLVGRTLRRLR